ncbi:hypothetical protein M422DRAFT_266315 [Sphaerobolus stellatus SS14]|uniref:Uncharacterized protein n=1 Tax=Sphaerobolus stellatus (strain SS14) TaxID=990650 RepID=A0A0C9V3B9_SPHS4|nr:hypothetical protein M422DRAFT_266315 [Sphaerobolus stellatus SS14]
MTLFLPVLALSLRAYAAVNVTASCASDSNFGWTLNSEGESPCKVAAQLQAACNNGSFALAPLGFGYQYPGPPIGGSNECACSTVTFSLMAACVDCQNGFPQTWAVWKTNCTPGEIGLQTFPEGIPKNVSIPTWAFLDVTGFDEWDSTASLTEHEKGTPDVTSLNAINRTSSPITPQSSSNTTPQSSSNFLTRFGVGRLAGVVIGSTAGMAIIGKVDSSTMEPEPLAAQIAPTAYRKNPTEAPGLLHNLSIVSCRRRYTDPIAKPNMNKPVVQTQVSAIRPYG